MKPTVHPPDSRYWGSKIRIRINRRFLDYCRTIHIYLSMFGLLVMFLFGLTGFTINHEDWFGANAPQVHERQVTLPQAVLVQNDHLLIVEHLRAALGISGAMTGFDDLDDRFAVGFKEPGQIWEVEIEKAGGIARVHQETFNFTALINNLHRGRYSGEAWRWVIDVAALMIVVACGTGMVLWMVLPRRRLVGVTALLLGILGTLLIYHYLVPGEDRKLPSTNSANVSSAGVSHR